LAPGGARQVRQAVAAQGAWRRDEVCQAVTVQRGFCWRLAPGGV